MQNDKRYVKKFYSLIDLKIEICFFFLYDLLSFITFIKQTIYCYFIKYIANEINGNCDCNERNSNVIVIKCNILVFQNNIPQVFDAFYLFYACNAFYQ